MTIEYYLEKAPEPLMRGVMNIEEVSEWAVYAIHAVQAMLEYNLKFRSGRGGERLYEGSEGGRL